MLADASDDSLLTATYRTQYVHHAQLEPPSALARFNSDGTLDVWMPNQAPDVFLGDIAKRTGLSEDKINVHSSIWVASLVVISCIQMAALTLKQSNLLKRLVNLSS
ncbi:molybdopterin cofactor-binding domain-containing protein [Vibrio olivae]